MRRTASRWLPAFLLLALAGCSSSNSVDTSVDKALGFQVGNGAAVVYKIQGRYAAKDFSGTTLTGTTLSSSSLTGKVVVVNFWNSECSPCVQEAPAFNQVARDDATKGVAFVGIDERDQVANARAWDVSHHVPYPSISDPMGRLTLDFPHAIPDSTPATVVLDRHGRIAALVNGALDYTHLAALVDTIVGQPA